MQALSGALIFPTGRLPLVSVAHPLLTNGWKRAATRMNRSTRSCHLVAIAAGTVLAALGSTWACEDGPIGPRHDYQIIAVGETLSARLPSGGNAQFAFPAEAESTYAVFLQAVDGTVLLSAIDPDRGLVLGAVQAAPGHHLLERATPSFGFGQGTVLLAVTGPGGVGYRLFIYPVRRKPESRPSRFVVGDTVTEPLETLADIDTFVVAGTTGAEVVGYIQARDSSAPGVVSLALEALAGAGSTVGDSDLEKGSTGRFSLPATRDYRITVQAAGDPLSGLQTYHGPYRFVLRAVQRAPETVAPLVQPGDTVAGERLDYVGDIDSYTLAGAPGQEVSVFFQATSGNAATRLELAVLDAAGRAVATVQSGGADPHLLGQAISRLTLPGTGTYRLEVSGLDDRSLVDRSPYRFWVYPVDHHPETAGDTVAYRDSILTEAIDAPGDIDEFQVSVPESTLANLVAKNDAADGSVAVSLLDSTGTQITLAVAYVPGGSAQSGVVALTPGAYRLRAEGSFGAASQYRGQYEVRLYAGFTQQPESLADTVTIPDTVSGEAISPPGDGDTFWFYAQRGEHIDLALEGQAAPSTGGFGAILFSPDVVPLSILGAPMQPDSLGAHESGRIDVAIDGWYRVSVSGSSNPPQIVEAGAYRFALTRLGTAPEHVGAALVPGDSVTAEEMDSRDDWDEFTLTGTSGQLLTIVARTAGSLPTGMPLLAVFDSITTDTVAWTPVQEFDRPTGYFSIPASGRLKVAVYRDPVFTGTYVGGYRFVVVPVNPAPETAPATFALGDTVRGEAVFPEMDVDEFSSTAAPGDTLAPMFRLLSDPVPSGRGLRIEVVDPGTGMVLIGSNVTFTGASADFLSPGVFVVPPTGAYAIRVRGGGFDEEQLVTAPFEFFVRQVP